VVLLMAMYKRDFTDLAEILSRLRPEPGTKEFSLWAHLVSELGTFCYARNGNFDRGRFEYAAGFVMGKP